MPRYCFCLLAWVSSTLAWAGPITVKPSPTTLVPVIEPLSYTLAPADSQVTNQYQNQGLRFDHTALGITKGITAWMPTGEGWLRYPGGDPDPYANQFNFYLGFRGVVTFDFVDANGAFAPVDWAKITVFGVDPVDLAMTFENAAGEWGGDPVSGLNAQSEHATMEISSNTSSIARVHVYQMLKYPYPDVPPAWGVTEIQYDRSAWASAPIATPEPSSILLGAIGLGSALLARRRGIKQRL